MLIKLTLTCSCCGDDFSLATSSIALGGICCYSDGVGGFRLQSTNDGLLQNGKKLKVKGWKESMSLRETTSVAKKTEQKQNTNPFHTSLLSPDKTHSTKRNHNKIKPPLSSIMFVYFLDQFTYNRKQNIFRI